MHYSNMDQESPLKAIHPNEEVFDTVFRTYYAPLTWFAQSILHDQQEAEDMVEESFLKLWETIENGQQPLKVKSWLYTCVHNNCMDQLRKQKVRKLYTAETIYTKDNLDQPIVNKIIAAETLHEIFQSLEILPLKCRQVFKLYYLHQKSLQEIATELGISISTVKSQKGRALQLLRNKISSLITLIIAVI